MHVTGICYSCSFMCTVCTSFSGFTCQCPCQTAHNPSSILMSKLWHSRPRLYLCISHLKQPPGQVTEYTDKQKLSRWPDKQTNHDWAPTLHHFSIAWKTPQPYSRYLVLPVKRHSTKKASTASGRMRYTCTLLRMPRPSWKVTYSGDSPSVMKCREQASSRACWGCGSEVWVNIVRYWSAGFVFSKAAQRHTLDIGINCNPEIVCDAWFHAAALPVNSHCWEAADGCRTEGWEETYRRDD